MKSRQDAWSEEDDLLLAETVLRHVREGSTQLNAFEEVGDKLNRTSAACGFRWNAVVRHNYEQALQLAKKQRKQRQRLLGKEQGGKKKLLYQPPVPTLEELGEIPLVTDQAEAEGQAGEGAQGTDNGEMNLVKVISYLQYLNNTQFQTTVLKSENARLKHENQELKKETEELKKRIKELEEGSVTMQEDYETLMKIMNRARKYVLFEEDDTGTTKFKMDRNGNLEKMAE
ncbi:prespore-specific transcriptional regulator RsfA [Weizmannia acidilactici]|uniref:Prespore-specific transcriptional regulator RsfA n=1 Tax=Weizmannia acidilactici TaxID=2607726 RepID=A0A5J4JC58_9BACI|nr:RsfA family transcriptional regulator [Weizmannia acidilactici]GER69523.1 prespore-specific transcriptional regulator RsfA [Weizmannia acidilactici]GER74020.1 prespore-specific transcriptional regulator RsfA [Weizmannia acidilactici]